MSASIRWAMPEDMDGSVRLCAEHAAYERSSFQPAGKEEALARMLFAPEARLRCLVAEMDNRLIGYATFSVEVSTWDADRYMHMDCLFLRPEARSQESAGRSCGASLRKRPHKAWNACNGRPLRSMWTRPVSMIALGP